MDQFGCNYVLQFIFVYIYLLQKPGNFNNKI